MRFLKLNIVLLTILMVIGSIIPQKASAERVYGSGSLQVGGDMQRKNYFKDKTVEVPLGVAWKRSIGNGSKGAIVTNYRVHFGSGNVIYGISDQTGSDNADTYTVGNPIVAPFSSSYGSVTSATEVLNYSASSYKTGLFFGTSGSRLGVMSNYGLYDYAGEQTFSFTPSLGGGSINYIGDVGTGSSVVAASDNQLHMVNTNSMTKTWTYNTTGTINGITTLGNNMFSIVTDNGDSEGHIYIYKNSTSSGQQTPTIDIRLQSGVPKFSAYSTTSGKLYTVDKKGRFYTHNAETGTVANPTWYIGSKSGTRGYDTVGGVALSSDEKYAYVSSTGSDVSLSKGTVTQFNLSNGDRKVYEHSSSVTTTPIVLGDLVYFGDSNGDVYALNGDSNFGQPVKWYRAENATQDTVSANIGSSVRYLFGADNHLYAMSDSQIWAFKGKPDYQTSTITDQNNSNLNNSRYDYTGSSLPTITLRNTTINSGSFDYSVYTDFGGVNHQRTRFTLVNKDTSQSIPITNSLVTNDVDDAFKSEVKPNDPEYFQVQAKTATVGKGSITQSYPFKPTSEGKYEMVVYTDADNEQSEFNEANNTKVATFDVVDMTKPTISSNKTSYMPNETVNFTLSKTQKYSFSNYTIEIEKPSNQVVKPKNQYSPFVTTETFSDTYELGSYRYRVVVNNRYGDSISSDWKSFTVISVPVTPDFTTTPNPTNRLTDVAIKSTVSNPNNLTLTYRYEIRKKGATTWTQVSTTKDFTYRFPQVGVYEVKQTVTDNYSRTGSLVKEVTVNNLNPNAGFTVTPNPTNRLTNTTIQGSATDPENDTLTYKYEVRLKGTTAWTQVSTSSNFSYKFPQVGVYEVKQTVTDAYGGVDTETKEVTVNNLAPVADFKVTPNPTDRLTTVNFQNLSTDPENDTISSYKYEYRKKGSTTWNTLGTTSNPSYKFSNIGVFEVRLTVTDQHGAVGISNIKEVTVDNLAPIANFTINPSPSDRLTSTQIKGTATDPENDTLTYNYTYREKGTTSWASMSSSKDFTFKFSKVTTYEIELTVTDSHGSKSTVRKEVTINNLSPTADFVIDKTPSDRNTPVKFSNNSTDPENDSLSYSYQYRKKGSSTWVNLATSSSTTHTFNDVGTFEVKLTVRDTYGATSEKIKEVVINNLKPTANFRNKDIVNVEGDPIRLENLSTDPENDPLTYEWSVTNPSGTTTKYTTKDLTINGALSGNYTIVLKVTDSYGSSDTTSKTISVSSLSIKGYVLHTSAWESLHEYYENDFSDFYSGEKFVLESETTDYPITKLTVKFSGYDVNDNLKSETTTLDYKGVSNSNRIFKGELYKDWMSDPNTKLKQGKVLFNFEATFTNGVVKTDIVEVNIIEDSHNVYDLHRTN